MKMSGMLVGALSDAVADIMPRKAVDDSAALRTQPLKSMIKADQSMVVGALARPPPAESVTVACSS